MPGASPAGGAARPRLRTRLRHEVPLAIPGFLNTVPRGTISQWMLDPRPAAEQFSAFVDMIESALGVRHLPVYRMADGEFIFSVGPKPPRALSAWHRLVWRAKDLVRPWVRPGMVGSVSTCWGEGYRADEMDGLRESYVGYLQHVARHGFLALHFSRTRDRFGEEYFRPMCDWLDANGVQVDERNYTSFWFVYALLNGPERRRVYEGRSVLIVTSTSEAKRAKIAATLRGMGVATVQFLEVSRDRTMTDRLDLSRVQGRVDLALVAGGIGSANLLVQLEPLQAVCIDVGICMECLVDPARKKERTFLLADTEA